MFYEVWIVEYRKRMTAVPNNEKFFWINGYTVNAMQPYLKQAFFA